MLKLSEDIRDWMKRQERTGQINRWGVVAEFADRAAALEADIERLTLTDPCVGCEDETDGEPGASTCHHTCERLMAYLDSPNHRIEVAQANERVAADRARELEAEVARLNAQVDRYQRECVV